MTSRPARISAVSLAILLTSASPAQNQAAYFPANSTSWISAPASLDLTNPTGLTVEAWVNVTSSMTPARGIINVPSTGGSFSYLMYVSANLQGNYVSFQAQPVAGQLFGTIVMDSGAFTSGTWHHVAGTYDGAAARLFVDGVIYAQWNQTGYIRPADNQMQIGSLGGSSIFKNGYLDCIRVWSYARSQAEIASTRFYEIPGMPGLVASWHLNGDLLDSTGTHDGTAVGSISMVTPGAPIIPMLAAPTVVIVGNPVMYQIATPFPLTPYVLDVSVTGTSPGVPLTSSILIPLNHPWLNYDTGGLWTAYFTNFLGLTNAIGGAQAFVTVPMVEALVGTTLSATYAVLEPGVPYGVAYVAPPTTTFLGTPPVVSGVSPPSGPTTGGTSVVVTGDHFVTGATVRFGAQFASGVNVVDGAHISCITPAQVAGPIAVTVTNPDTLNAVLPNGFTYAPPLSLSGVAPVVAPAGAVITATGAGFVQGTTVTVGSIPVTPMTTSSTQITFTNPPNVPCNTTVQVANPDGQTASKPFNPSPSVSLVFPNAGPAAGGNTVSLFGANLFAGTTATVNGNPAMATGLGTSLTLVMPPGTPGPAQIVLTSINGCSGTASYTYQ